MPGRFTVPVCSPSRLKSFHDRLRILHVVGNDLAADEVYAIEDVFRLGDHLAPVFGVRFVRVNHDQAIPWCGVVRPKIQVVTDIAHERVVVIEAFDQELRRGRQDQSGADA